MHTQTKTPLVGVFSLGIRVGFEPKVPIFLKRFALGKKWSISSETRGESYPMHYFAKAS
jgi:hypothetical protein